MNDVLMLERAGRGGVIERSRHEKEIDLLEGAATGFRAEEIDEGDGEEVENQEPDPCLPTHSGVSDGDGAGEDGDEGHDPLSGDAESEPQMTVTKRHNLRSVDILYNAAYQLSHHDRRSCWVYLQ